MMKLHRLKIQKIILVLIALIAYQGYIFRGFVSNALKAFPRNNVHDIDSKLQPDGMSIFISVYRQPKCLQQMVQYFRLCPVVREIRINWFQDDALLRDIPEAYFSNGNSSIPVHFDVLPNNLTNRFSPHRPPPLSIATFHVDVDTMYSCRALQFAYDIWVHKFHASSHTVVGFHPRNLKSKGGYYQWDESFRPPFRHNTLFATKGAIMHKHVLSLFFMPKYQHWRNLVDTWITAEDILLSFVLAIHNISTVALCLDPEDTCALECSQGKQSPLYKRTSGMRRPILDQLYGSFGEILPQKGVDEMIWWNNNSDSTNGLRCDSMPLDIQSISHANPKCRWFCENTPICPQNPSPNDTAEEW
jgi:hypothetical protein